MENEELRYKRRDFRTIRGKRIVLNEPLKEVSKRMQKVRSKNTKIELAFEAKLKESKLLYARSENIIEGLLGNPDFVIPKYKIAIFCDGDFWHGKNGAKIQTQNNEIFWEEKIQTNIDRDLFVKNELEKADWKVFRYWESDINKDADKCIDEIKEYITTVNNTKGDYAFTFVDLFSGIGGFRVPLDELGGKCLGYSEINKKSIDTYRRNFSSYPNDSDEFLGDITKLNKVELQESIDLVVGGVPCQAWSVAGKMMGFDDPRGKLWEDSIRFVKLNKPKAFIFENVKGLYDPRNKKNLKLIISELNKAGYKVVKPQLLNSYDFGVPQNRDRIFIVGFRKELILETEFQYPKPLSINPKLGDILDFNTESKLTKKKLNLDQLHEGKAPFSRNRFQKIDEFNDFFIFCDTRNGHTTIHSWDIYRTSKREKEICLTILKNRRKSKYGRQDGNPLSFDDLLELIPKLKEKELEKLVDKKILKKIEEKYEFVNSKNSSGINDIYRVYLPTSDIFSTLTATGTKDMIALTNVSGDTVQEYKENFIKEIYRKKKFRPINSREAGRLQGFPKSFAVHEKCDIAKSQFGNAVSIPVIYNLAKNVIQTGIFSDGQESKTRDFSKIQTVV